MLQINAPDTEGQQEYGGTRFGTRVRTFPAFCIYSAGPNVSYDPDIFGDSHRLIQLAPIPLIAQRTSPTSLTEASACPFTQ